MTRDEHRAAIQRILGFVSPEHQADASEALTSLSDDYSEMLNTSETLRTQNQTLSNDFENLRRVNAKLFLRVGEHTEKQQEEPERKKENEPLPFDSLFNEKGELI